MSHVTYMIESLYLYKIECLKLCVRLVGSLKLQVSFAEYHLKLQVSFAKYHVYTIESLQLCVCLIHMCVILTHFYACHSFICVIQTSKIIGLFCKRALRKRRYSAYMCVSHS